LAGISCAMLVYKLKAHGETGPLNVGAQSVSSL
jgi:hypothetical protein